MSDGPCWVAGLGSSRPSFRLLDPDGVMGPQATTRTFKDAVYKGAAAIRPMNVPCPHVRVIPGVLFQRHLRADGHEPFYEVKARLIRSASTTNRHSDIAPPIPGRAVVLKWLCGPFPGITRKCEPGASS